nr:MAG TPA: Sigma factor AlgU negative regulatory factor, TRANSCRIPTION.96A [Caudoviricetes sp.]
MSEGTIAELSGMSQQRVNALKNSRIYRMKTLMCRVLKQSLKDIIG